MLPHLLIPLYARSMLLGFAGAVSVVAAFPAARATLASHEFAAGDLYTAYTSFGFFGSGHPAYKFVAGERGYVFPSSFHLGV